MKILLVKAANISNINACIIPPLGLLYLASSLRMYRHSDEIKFFDCRIRSDKEFIELVRDWQPDIVGISALTCESKHSFELSRFVKDISSRIIVVIGGPFPTSCSEDVLSCPDVDYTVLHEGELTFCELINAIESGRPISEIRGIGYRNKKGLSIKTEARFYIDNLDEISYPAWDLIDFSVYAKLKPMSQIGPRRVAPIFTSRACPYRCTYCHNMFGKKFQKRSVDNVLEEIKLLVQEYNVRHFEIIDDIFNIDKVRTKQILEGIINLKLDIKLAFPNGLRGDLLTEELVDLFVKAGTECVSIAIETASPRLQKHIRKHVRLEKAQNAIRWFTERRIFTNCFYMIGFPSETIEEMNQTIKFACAQPSHTAFFFKVTPFKGTEVITQMIDVNADVHHKFERYQYHTSDMNISGNIPTKTLQRAIKFAYIRFLFNPKRCYRIIRDHPYKRSMWASGRLLFNRLMYNANS